MHTVNAMLNTIAKTGDLEKVVEVVTALAERGFVADKYTYSAILNACQHANAGELAFTIWRSPPPPPAFLCFPFHASYLPQVGLCGRRVPLLCHRDACRPPDAGKLAFKLLTLSPHPPSMNLPRSALYR